MNRVIVAIIILLMMSFALSKANGVTYTEEQLEYLDQKIYDGPRFKSDKRIDELVQYAYTHCVERIGTGANRMNGANSISRSCKDLILTRTAENGARGWRVVSPTNDHGLCQLNYRRHKSFIDTEAFKNPINQIHYCQEVWEDAMRKGSMPWVAYSKRKARAHLFTGL